MNPLRHRIVSSLSPGASTPWSIFSSDDKKHFLKRLSLFSQIDDAFSEMINPLVLQIMLYLCLFFLLPKTLQVTEL